MKVNQFFTNLWLIIKEKKNDKNWLLDAVMVASIFTIFLSVLSFGASDFSSKADTKFFMKGVQIAQFNGANSAVSKDRYDFQGLYFALYSYYLAADRPIDTTTLWNIRTGYMRDGNTFDEYYQITSNSIKEINDKRDKLADTRDFWNTVSKFIFWFMVVVQGFNVCFAYRLEKLDNAKKL